MLVRKVQQLLCQPNGWSNHGQQVIDTVDVFLALCDKSSDDGHASTVPVCCAELRSLLACLPPESGRLGLVGALQAVLQLIKVLLHNALNRKWDAQCMDMVLKALQLYIAQKQWLLVTDTCSVLLNACHETTNTNMLIASGGLASLLHCLTCSTIAREPKFVATVLGCLQAVCYVPNGRQLLRHSKAISVLVGVLEHADRTVRHRAIGTLHNLSVDIASISPIIQANGLAIMQHLDNTEALGVLQNLIRDPIVKAQVCGLGGVGIVLRLLSHADMDCQVAALSVLICLLDNDAMSNTERRSLHQTLADVIALGAIYACLVVEDAGDCSS